MINLLSAKHDYICNALLRQLHGICCNAYTTRPALAESVGQRVKTPGREGKLRETVEGKWMSGKRTTIKGLLKMQDRKTRYQNALGWKMHDQTSMESHSSNTSYIHCVSIKRDPDIIDCNFKKDKRILTSFGPNISDTTGHQMALQVPASPNIRFYTTWGNQNIVTSEILHFIQGSIITLLK